MIFEFHRVVRTIPLKIGNIALNNLSLWNSHYFPKPKGRKSLAELTISTVPS